MDLLDRNNVSWVDYFAEIPQTFPFLPSAFPFVTAHSAPVSTFLAQAAAGTLPSVSFVDPIFGVLFGVDAENDEHPPTDIRKGEAFVSTIVNAVRNGPNWKDSIIFIVYDEHGGFYDHVAPPRRRSAAQCPTGSIPGNAPICRTRRPARCRAAVRTATS